MRIEKWLKFLKDIIPEEKTRKELQKLFGMRLLFWKIRKVKGQWEVRRTGKNWHIHLGPNLLKQVWRCLAHH